jgi:two-component system chemotaxis response regulator CheY
MSFAGTVLIVDDESHIRKYVGLILRQFAQLTIIEAANGEEALGAYERERPQLVLLDVNMPHMDGIETLRRLKEIDPTCSVIMLTSLANRKTVEEALALGALDYLRKDTSKDEMAKTLTDYFGSLDASASAPASP